MNPYVAHCGKINFRTFLTRLASLLLLMEASSLLFLLK